jgi:cellulose synthase/poly-beta-1,6-N-acetylglucosamine synthase-like glycosyltransferase
MAVLLVLAASALLAPAVVLFVECTVALLVSKPRRSADGRRPSVAVLVPAHNEALVIGGTVRDLRSQLLPTDELVVIADNCTDDTAGIARANGATVVERDDTERRGKGFALERGVQHLEKVPPEVVVVVDADCRLQAGSMERLAMRAVAEDRPMQARYLLVPDRHAGPFDALAAFAFLVRNVVRPTGLACLGLPCQLTGTGMAFPWHVLRAVPLGSDALVEDLRLGLDLTLAGHPPMLCTDAIVTSPLPRQRHARTSQRRRWEHGHLETLLDMAPRVIVSGLGGLRLATLALGLDLCVPPLSLLFLAIALVTMIAAGAFAVGASGAPLMVASLAFALVLGSVGAAWIGFGRRDYRASLLLGAPLYALAKVPIYVGFLVRREREWVRTDRDETGEGKPAGPDARS